MADTDLATPPDMEIPERLNIADAIVSRHVREGRGDRPALHCGLDTMTYRELDVLSDRAGNALRAVGLGKGDRFMIRAFNSFAYAGAILGGMKIGAVPIPSSTLFRSWEVEHTLVDSDVQLVLTSHEHVDVVEAVAAASPTLTEVMVLDDPPSAGRRSFSELCARQPAHLEQEDTRAEDVAYTIYTSGTTGRPKGIEHAHRVLIGAGHPVVFGYLRLEEDECCLIPLELSWMMTLDFSLMFPLYAGARAALYRGRLDPDRLLEQVAALGVTRLVGAPSMFHKLLSIPGIEERHDFSSIRMALVGGEPLPEATHREVQARLGFPIYEMFGQTEAHVPIANPTGEPPRPGSMGRPLPGRGAAIIGDDDTELAVGETGRLCFPSGEPGLASGYRNMEREWRSRHHNGWYDSGDLAYRDEHGYFWYVARSDDVIVSRAYRVAPAEVEAAARDHPAVAEAAVVGVPDPLIGQRIKAFLALRPDVDAGDALAEEILEHMRTLIALYKVPKEIVFVDELPKGLTGKVLRRALRDRAAEAPS